MKDDVGKAIEMLNSIVTEMSEYTIARDKNRYYVCVYAKKNPDEWFSQYSAKSKHLIVAAKSAILKATMGKL